MQQNDFHITIGSSSREPNFENDLRLVKSSLLYADKIKLCSPISSESLRYLTIIEEKNPKKLLEFLESYSSYFMDNDVSQNFLKKVAVYKKMLQKKHLTGKELQSKINFERLLKKSFLPIKEKVLETAENMGMKPLVPLIEKEILEISPLGEPSSFDYEKLTKKFVNFLEETISDNNTYPLFNDEVGNLVKLGIKAERIMVSETGIVRGKHSSLAANLLERLPLFDEAEVNEILDIRKELDRPLKRFRSSMIEFSESIKNAAWDDDFSHDAETVFRRDIEPAILDIEDAVKSNSSIFNLSSFFRKSVEKPASIVPGSALSLLMSQWSEIPQVVSLGLGILTSSAVVISEIHEEWKENKKDSEQNCLFFYYKSGERLSNLK